MLFTIQRAHLEFEALEEISVPPGRELNTFRGALGYALREVACQPDCRSAKTCSSHLSCPYARFFEPSWSGGPSGYREAPRPFVFRGPPVTAASSTIPRGQTLRANLFVFDRDRAPWSDLRQAFERVAAQGIGPARCRARLKAFSYGGAGETSELQMPLQTTPASLERRQRIRLLFVTPTELKADGAVATQPDFAVLTQRLLERLWALGSLYQGWKPEDWDYRELLDLGRRVQLLDWSWRHHDAQRRSSRTGQRHSIGGFTGWAEYEGPIGPFLPILQIARWIGVGRQTVWGKGEIHVGRISEHQNFAD